MSGKITSPGNPHSPNELLKKIAKLEKELSEKSEQLDKLAPQAFGYQAILATSEDYIFINEFVEGYLPGKFVQVNENVCQRLGYSKEELLSLTPFDLMIRDEQDIQQKEFEMLNSKQSLAPKPVTLTAKNGDHIPVIIHAKFYKANDKTYVVTVARDVTQQIRSQKQLNRAQVIAKIGYWCVVENKTTWSDNYYKLLGYKPNQVESTETLFVSHIHPEDRDRVLQEMQFALKKKHNTTSEFRYITRSGEIRWAQSQAEMVLGENNEIQSVDGVFQDITEQKENEQRYQLLFNKASDAIYLADMDCNLIDVNDRACEDLGYTREELMSLKISDVDMGMPDIEACKDFISKMERDSFTRLESEHVHKDGSRKVVEVNVGKLEINGSPHVLGIARDVTKERKAEQALKESETMFRELFQHINSGVTIYQAIDDGENFVFVDINQAGQKIGNLVKKDILGKSITQIYPKVKDTQVMNTLQRVWQSGKSEHLSLVMTGAYNREQWIENYVFKLPSGKIVALYDDISAHRTAQQKLKESEERYRVLANATLEAVFISEKGICIDTNDTAVKMFGYTHEEIIGVFSTDVIAPESKELVQQNILSGFDKPYEAMAQRKDGTKFPALFHGRMFEYAGKNIRLTTCRDLTEQKLYEDEIKKNQRRSERAEKIARFGYWEFHFNSGMVLASKGAQSIYGFITSGDTLTIKDVQGMVLPKDRPLLDTSMSELIKNIKPYDVQFQIKRPIDGKIVDIHSIAEYDRDRNVVFGVIHDITAQKQAERAIRESESRFKALFNYAPIGIGISTTERKGLLSQTNKALQKFLGYTADELKDMHFQDITFPDDYEIDVEKFRELEKGLRDNYHLEKRYITKDSNIVWGSLNVSLIRNDVGDPYFMLAMIENITRRKNVEEIVHKSLEEKEILLKEIHHRVKNNLQIIISLLNMQSIKFSEPIVRQACEESRLRIYSMALVHEKLYQADNFSRINFKEYIKFLTENIISTLDNKETVSYEIEMPELYLGLDFAIPCGLIVNELLTNAVKHAFPDNRKGLIRVCAIVTESGEVKFSIKDNGVGLPVEWESFKGQSLGMQLIEGLVKQIKGKLNINQDGGTQFIIHFSPESEL